MEATGCLTMSRKELNRLEILSRGSERWLTQAEAAEQLGWLFARSERLCRKLRLEGPEGLISKRSAK